MVKNICLRLVHRFYSRVDWNVYWRLRNLAQINKTGGVKRALALLWVRRIESRFCASTGLNANGPCCQIAEPLRLYHGLYGIVIAANVCIGRNVTIFQHVTITESDRSRLTIIEDDVMIGAGAVLINNPHIGRGARIGANAVVVCDVPAGATAIGVPARILQ